MKMLRTIRRILAVAIALWAMAVVAYFLFFAKISFESETVSVNEGEPPVTTRYSGQIPRLSEAEPVGVAVMIALSLLLAAGAIAVLRGALAATFITGFSTGGPYFPGAVAMFVGTALLAFEKASRHPNPPAA